MGAHEHSAEYVAYMASPAWRERRAWQIERTGRRCQRCFIHESESPLEVHHKTYERLGNERWEDLETLCPSCHEIADAERAAAAEARSRAALHSARVWGFAERMSARSGRDVDFEEAEEALDRWLERRGDR